jgi:POT family proton-dependent oligopeptide transporter
MTAVGNFVAGKIGEATRRRERRRPAATLSIYSEIGWVAVGAGVVVLALSPIVKRWMHRQRCATKRPPPRHEASR